MSTLRNISQISDVKSLEITVHRCVMAGTLTIDDVAILERRMEKCIEALCVWLVSLRCRRSCGRFQAMRILTLCDGENLAGLLSH